MAIPRTESSSGILGRRRGLASGPSSLSKDAIEKAVLRESVLVVFCTLLGIVQVCLSRYAMNPDGISYLDIGDSYFRRDWASAVNGYWSPLYSWWLGLALYIVKPSLRWEFITVHFVNLIIYVVALFSFRFFIHSVLRAIRLDENGDAGNSVFLPEWVLLGLGYSVFLWATLVLIDPGLVTPDLLVAGIVFLIGGYLVELRVDESYGKFAIFGVLCGAAYLGKAIMFPLGFGFLGILLLSGRTSKKRVGGVLLSALLFMVVSSPYIAALSKQKGRLTFGDSGRLAYSSSVSPGAPQVHWQGEPAGSGVPRHTTRQLLDHPPVFEFAGPVGGTYPPWYDPSYWNEGVRANFQLRSQIRVLAQSARNYATILLGQLGLLAGLLIFVYWGGAPARGGIVSNWPLIAAAGLTIAAYSLVLVRPRYVAASVVLLSVGVLAGIRLPQDEKYRPVIRYVTVAVMATILLAIVVHLAETAYITMTVYGYPTQKNQMEAAVGLQNMGLRPGDRVAVIGDGATDFWARLGRFRIVAEAFSPDAGNRQFWSESWERRELAYGYLARTGARAVVVWAPPESAVNAGWKQIPNTNYYVRFLAQ
jgi:hypothetical protein